MNWTSDTPTAQSKILDSYEAYGCHVNAIGVDELFRRYEQTGFLYPAKMKHLAPFWTLIRDNWKRALRGGELIHYIVTTEQTDRSWASITSWRSTRSGWNTQHLVGIGGPEASRAVMLATQASTIRDQHHTSHQNWFQRSNRFANKVFGSISTTLSSHVADVGDYSYFSVPLSTIQKATGGVHVRNAKEADAEGIRLLAESQRSAVFASAEGLDDHDLQLNSIDDLYRKVGLRRYRRVVLAELSGVDTTAGFALAYRGPLGLNFSFLENRCDLVINPTLNPEQRRAVIGALLSVVAEHYTDFPPQAIPVIVEKPHAADVRSLGGMYVRDYAQSIWLQEGYEPWYRHVEHVYDRVSRANRRVSALRPRHISVNKGGSSS